MCEPSIWGGQPDSVAVSPDQRYAAIAIENERNEDLCVGGTLDGQEAAEDDCAAGGGVLGGLPQLPAGFLVIVELTGPPASWTTRPVSLTGLAHKFPEDPEPEYVDINRFNVAAVTLQENNHIVLVYLPSGTIVHHFSAGRVNLSQVDTQENALIELNDPLNDILCEPDAWPGFLPCNWRRRMKEIWTAVAEALPSFGWMDTSISPPGTLSSISSLV